MTIKSKLALLSMIAMIGAASPAFAQSFGASLGTGNVPPFSSQPTTSESGKVAVHNNGLRSYAMANAGTRSDHLGSAQSDRGTTSYNQTLMAH